MHQSLVAGRNAKFTNNGKHIVVNMPFVVAIYELPISIQGDASENTNPPTHESYPLWLIVMISVTGVVVVLLLVFVICLSTFFER